MATKWVVCRETNVGSSQRQVIPRWLFEDKPTADTWARRLGRAAVMAKALANLDEPWQGDDHPEWVGSALATLQELDPDAQPGVLYKVCPVEDFVAPEETPPPDAKVAWWRMGRDAP